MIHWHIKMNATLCSLRGVRKRPINPKGPSQLQQERSKMPSVNFWVEARFPSSAARKWQIPLIAMQVCWGCWGCACLFHTLRLSFYWHWALQGLSIGEGIGERKEGIGEKEVDLNPAAFWTTHSNDTHLPSLKCYTHLYPSQISSLNFDLMNGTSGKRDQGTSGFRKVPTTIQVFGSPLWLYLLILAYWVFL